MIALSNDDLAVPTATAGRTVDRERDLMPNSRMPRTVSDPFSNPEPMSDGAMAPVVEPESRTTPGPGFGTALPLDNGASIDASPRPTGVFHRLWARLHPLDAPRETANSPWREEVERIEAKLVEQEHRAPHVFWNAVQSFGWEEGDPRRVAARRALVWRVVTPTAAVASGALAATVIALLSLCQLQEQTAASEEQNVLISDQNAFLRREIQQSSEQHFQTMRAQLTATIYDTRECTPSENAEKKSDRHKYFDGLPDSSGIRWMNDLHVTGSRCPSASREARRDAVIALVYMEQKVRENPEIWPGVFLPPLSGGLTASIRGANLAGVDLSGMRFENVDFGEVDFSRAKMHGVEFFNCWIQKANFNGADLSRSEFFYSDLDAAMFSDADLEQTLFVGSMLNEVLIAASTTKDVRLILCGLLDLFMLGGPDETWDVIQNLSIEQSDIGDMTLSDVYVNTGLINGAALPVVESDGGDQSESMTCRICPESPSRDRVADCGFSVSCDRMPSEDFEFLLPVVVFLEKYGFFEFSHGESKWSWEK